jgi:hypothetical protein
VLAREDQHADADDPFADQAEAEQRIEAAEQGEIPTLGRHQDRLREQRHPGAEKCGERMGGSPAELRVRRHRVERAEQQDGHH